MGQPAAKQGDKIIAAADIHIVMVPSPPGSPVPTPLPHPFSGTLDGNLSSDVKIMGMAAATVGSTATNSPPHIPTPPGVSFQSPPENKGTIMMGSATVKINGKMAARSGDQARTCGTPPNLAAQVVAAPGTVMIGG
jgi:uncharacterized Zn-binding protein involved in type VI secretion